MYTRVLHRPKWLALCIRSRKFFRRTLSASAPASTSLILTTFCSPLGTALSLHILSRLEERRGGRAKATILESVVYCLDRHYSIPPYATASQNPHVEWTSRRSDGGLSRDLIINDNIKFLIRSVCLYLYCS